MTETRQPSGAAPSALPDPMREATRQLVVAGQEFFLATVNDPHLDLQLAQAVAAARAVTIGVQVTPTIEPIVVAVAPDGTTFRKLFGAVARSRPLVDVAVAFLKAAASQLDADLVEACDRAAAVMVTLQIAPDLEPAVIAIAPDGSPFRKVFVLQAPTEMVH